MEIEISAPVRELLGDAGCGGSEVFQAELPGLGFRRPDPRPADPNQPAPA